MSIEYYINALAETYINVQTDTAIALASKAYSEAIKIHYIEGVGDAVQNLGEIARDRNDYIAAEEYFRQSIALFKAIHSEEKYSWAHFTLGWCLHRQGKFDDAKWAFKQAIPYYVKTGNKERESALLRMISYTYGERGYNEKAFEYLSQAIKITFKVKDSRGLVSSPQVMGNLYKQAGETETALTYYQIAAQNAKKLNQPVRYNRLMGNIAMLLDQLDSAIYYYKESHNCVKLKTTDTAIVKRSFCYQNLSMAEIYLEQRKYNSAIEQLKLPLQFFEKGNDKNGVMRTLYPLASCYQMQQKFSTSFLYTKRLLETAQATGARPFIRDAYKLYWEIYDKLGKTDSAYKYNIKYIALKDSILSDEYRRNIALSEMRSQDEQQKTKISLLQKDQQLSKETLSLQQQKLRSESLIRYILFATTSAFVLIAFFIFRNINLKRKNERQHLEHALALQQLESQKSIIEFQQQTTELEMQALRAQMNPHFIFNCLSSINRFILINKTEQASDYLTKFSRLIRMALHNSEKSFITLESELEALRLYLDLERLRFKNAFNYSITFINTIDVSTVFIPPLLIQPFTENAIWHGLMHKDGTGNLDIALSVEEKILTCIITDDGIGRSKAAVLKSKSAEKNKGLGIQITVERLALLNGVEHKKPFFNVVDLVDSAGNACGTKVMLQMEYRDLIDVDEC